jgi:hypothetical protein
LVWHSKLLSLGKVIITTQFQCQHFCKSILKTSLQK